MKKKKKDITPLSYIFCIQLKSINFKKAPTLFYLHTILFFLLLQPNQIGMTWKYTIEWHTTTNHGINPNAQSIGKFNF